MKWFEESLQASEMMQQIKQAKSQGAFPIQLNGCVDVQIAHMMHLLGSDKKKRLIVTYSEDRAKQLLEELKAFERDVLYYPAKDALFFSADVHGQATQNQRLEVIKQMLKTGSATVVTTIDGGLDRVVHYEELAKQQLTFAAEGELDLDTTKGQLVDMGYEYAAMVERPGEFCVRGGILDVFPIGEDSPCRIELWGDEIDTIRSFDAESQRSIETLDEITIFPATELPLPKEILEEGQKKIEEDYDVLLNQYRHEQKNKEAYNLQHAVRSVLDALSTSRTEAGIDSFITYFYENTISFLDYFDDEDSVVFYEEPSWIKEVIDSCETEFHNSMEGRLTAGYILPAQMEVYFSKEEIDERIQRSGAYYFSKIGYDEPDYPAAVRVDVHAHRTNTYQNHMELLIKDMKSWLKEDYRIMLLSSSSTRAKKLQKELEEEGFTVYFVEDMKEEVQPGHIGITMGSISCGFTYPEEKIAIISESDVIKQKRKKKRHKPRYKGEVIKNFDDLSVGDYVVHEDRGVGIYRGIVQREIDGIIKDYISIEYAGGDMYYINVSQMDKVQRFASADARPPKLSKLGGKDWDRIKSRVKNRVGILAKELIQLYAIRQEKQGFSCDKDTVWQTEFEEQFPFEETDDQMKAIEETKRDMESTRIMDRLICGDVGYGKTEVALRAAFKAVNNSKQVVYLVPTTVLAQQHYETFCERMKNYPVTIKMLSRFCTAKESKETLEGLKQGKVDIVIGTHRVFSKDVVYRNLGLLIIDEEQRFGVTHKEKIKQMKKDVDVLTLTATPIPRTLHMSLSGIRDMSLLNEAPVNRHAIQTYVMEYNEEMIKEAIKREVARGGQVYYVFNRVKNIEEMTQHIQELVPGAKVAYGHGQMSESQLEHVMLDFNAGKIDVLVATTIIETGLDIPNVNTIIIHDADTFGLAQLYQLRGRVGRSTRRAYAFLLYRRDKLIKETAEKRLAAIREFTDLGSGFKIAMRDLEIRGAGNVLGEDQSGHMEAVGYDLYCKMLNDALCEMRGEMSKELIDTTVEVDFNAYIPSTYVRNEFQKLDLYKRIATVATRDDLEDMTDELIDRYGELPDSTSQLLEIALIKNTASKSYITRIKQTDGKIVIVLYPTAPVDIEKLDAWLKKARGTVKFEMEKQPKLVVKTGHLKKAEVIPRIWELVDAVSDILEEDESQ